MGSPSPVSDTDPEPSTVSDAVLPHWHNLSRNFLAPALCPPGNTSLKAASAHFKVLLVPCFDRLSLCATKPPESSLGLQSPSIPLGFSPTLSLLTSLAQAFSWSPHITCQDPCSSILTLLALLLFKGTLSFKSDLSARRGWSGKHCCADLIS